MERRRSAAVDPAAPRAVLSAFRVADGADGPLSSYLVDGGERFVALQLLEPRDPAQADGWFVWRRTGALGERGESIQAGPAPRADAEAAFHAQFQRYARVPWAQRVDTSPGPGDGFAHVRTLPPPPNPGPAASLAARAIQRAWKRRHRRRRLIPAARRIQLAWRRLGRLRRRRSSDSELRDWLGPELARYHDALVREGFTLGAIAEVGLDNDDLDAVMGPSAPRAHRKLLARAAARLHSPSSSPAAGAGPTTGRPDLTDVPEDLLVHADEVEREELLGEGHFGEVFRARWHGGAVVLKSFKPGVRLGGEGNFLRELRVLHRLRHPRVVLFLGFCVEPRFLLFEYLAGGSLSRRLRDSACAPLTAPQKQTVALDVALGLAYLHGSSPSVLHRDLSTDNVLLTDTGRAKVADFGLSRVESAYAAYSGSGASGNVFYTAPEVFRGEPFTAASDVFSFGVCLWELYAERRPYDDLHVPAGAARNNVLASQVGHQGLRPPLAVLPAGVRAVVECCWRAPAGRPGMSAVVAMLDHPGQVPALVSSSSSSSDYGVFPSSAGSAVAGSAESESGPELRRKAEAAAAAGRARMARALVSEYDDESFREEKEPDGHPPEPGHPDQDQDQHPGPDHHPADLLLPNHEPWEDRFEQADTPPALRELCVRVVAEACGAGAEDAWAAAAALPPHLRLQVLERLSFLERLDERAVWSLYDPLEAHHLPAGDAGLSVGAARALLEQAAGGKLLTADLSGLAITARELALCGRLRLSALDLSMCERLSAADVQAALLPGPGGSGPSQLAQLVMNSCEFVDDALLAAVGGACPLLRVLHVNRGYLHLTQDHVTSAGLAVLARGCARLEELHVCYRYAATDEAVGALAAHCPRLRELNLKGCSNLTNASAPFLAAMGALETVWVDFDELDDAFVGALVAPGGPPLRTLSLENGDVTSAAMERLAERGLPLRKLKLKSLAVSDAAVAAAVRACGAQLVAVKISNCDAVGDALGEALGATAPLLRELDVSWTQLTDAGLAHVAAGCRRLRRLCLVGVQAVTTPAIVAAAWPRLVWLDLKNCRGITDEPLIAYVEATPGLSVVTYHGIVRGAMEGGEDDRGYDSELRL